MRACRASVVLSLASSIALSLGSLAACDAPAPSDAGPRDAASHDAGPPRDAGAQPPLRVLSVEDIGELPHPSETVVGRDGTSSGVLDGEVLWAFGDTFVSTPTPTDGSHVVSATGAWASPDAPLELEQPVDAEGIPTQLIPYNADELAQNRAAPLDGWSLWPGAILDTGGDSLLVLFQRIKRTAGEGFDGVGLGTARISPRETVARRDPDDLFSRPLAGGGTLLYGVGGVAVEAETAYFFACEAIAPFNQACRVARVPLAQADRREAFEFYDGEAWSADIEAAAVVIENVGSAHSVVYNAHLGRYLSVTSRVLSDEVVLRTAPRIEGPWPRTGVVIAPEEGGIRPAGEGSNYLAQEQPAFSSADGREVVISYSRPLGSFRGEVRLARITLE